MKNLYPENKEKFLQTLGQLKQKLLSFHDTKAKNESFISEDYLDYLALKYTAKSYKEICDTCDTDALETILHQFQ